VKFSIIPTDRFKKEAKRLIKKFPSLKQEIANLGILLETSPDSGTPLGNDTYKIRLGIKSKGKGKSGGARIITYVVMPNNEVYLLTVYDKSEFDSIDDKTIKIIVDSLATKK
jgi:mRNA-degrading endonuclease RelE of RelBE toxin-antitoxin system